MLQFEVYFTKYLESSCETITAIIFSFFNHSSWTIGVALFNALAFNVALFDVALF